jgi:hypothetical protein
MALAWDYTVLPFQSFEATRRNLSRSGGLTISGTEQVVQSSSDFWAINATVRIHRREHILAYRALQAQSFGRATEWLIPVPISAGIFVQTRIITNSATEASFSSEFSPEFPEEDIIQIITRIPYPHVTGRMTATALRSSGTISFTMDNPAWVPIPGIYFSIGSRLYMMATVSNSGTTFTATFVPKLRATAITGATIEFSQPKCLMRLAQDNIGQMNLDMLKFADVSLNFVEVPA